MVSDDNCFWPLLAFKKLKTLVQFPTHTGQETDGQKYRQSLYSNLGLEVVLLKADPGKVRDGFYFCKSQILSQKLPILAHHLFANGFANQLGDTPRHQKSQQELATPVPDTKQGHMTRENPKWHGSCRFQKPMLCPLG